MMTRKVVLTVHHGATVKPIFDFSDQYHGLIFIILFSIFFFKSYNTQVMTKNCFKTSLWCWHGQFIQV